MSPAIRLLGRPSVRRASGEEHGFRSRKSWAVLAYLMLSDRAPTRSELATLLYAEADDPLRALRWNLSEIRGTLGAGARLGGDPVTLELPPDTVVDVQVVTRGSWAQAITLDGLGADLLEGLELRHAATFSTWLLSAQRRVAAASEAILHEAAVGAAAQGRYEEAIDHAVRASAMSPLDENHHALLIRLYRQAGDPTSARRQYETCVELFRLELGTDPGGAVDAAIHAVPRDAAPVVNSASVHAILEAGTAAIAAGAIEPGLESLRMAVRLSDRDQPSAVRSNARLVLAEALIHSLGGLDEEGLAWLHEADGIATAAGDRATAAQARAELGYVDFLRARYDRAGHWLTRALECAEDSVATMAKATTYLGCVASDRADHPRALALLTRGVELARRADDRRREAFATSMLGRIRLLRGELDRADELLSSSIRLAEDDHWLAFVPWPQSLRGHAQLAAGQLPAATTSLQQAFARACQIGDPCWEGIAMRGTALVSEARGDVDEAFLGLIDARTRCNRLADPYVWLDVHILDALCELGCRYDHPETATWVATMRELSSRTGMRALEVRSLRHGAALGDLGAGESAELLAAELAGAGST